MADKYFKCLVEGCTDVFPKYNTLALHYGGKHRGSPIPTKEECEVDSIPEGYTLRLPATKPTPPEPNSAAPAKEEASNTSSPTVEEASTTSSPSSPYRAMPEPASILKSILENYPDLKKAVTTEIMNWVDLKGILHPMEVRHLLSQMAGVPKGAADIIPQKYQLAMAKAAAEGDAEVQMTVAGWQMNPMGGGQFSPTLPGQGQFNLMGGGFNPMGGMTGFNPMGGGFGGFGGFPFNPAHWNPWTQPPAPTAVTDPEQQKRLEKLEAEQTGITKSLEALLQKLTESEQEKKEAALNARLKDMETALVQLISKPKNGEEPNAALTALMEEFKETKTEFAKIREESTQAHIKNLENQLSNLSKQLQDQAEDRLRKLEEDLADARDEARRPVTGRTEMDVVSDLANKTLETVKDAGKDIKSVVLAGETRKNFEPNRVPVKETRAAGEKVAQVIEEEAAISAAEQAYIEQTGS